MKNQWLMLALPLAVIVPLFVIISMQPGKTVGGIVSNAVAKSKNLTAYLITADVITNINVMGSDLTYVSNTTIARSNNEYYTKIISNEPFTGMSVTTEQFILSSGNYSCTNSYATPFCINDVMAVPSLSDVSSEDYERIDYLGGKKISDRYCDALFTRFNSTDLSSLSGILDNETIDGIQDAFSYSCIDPENGLSIESLFSMNGVTHYDTMEIDVGINITKRLNTLSSDVPSELFKLPYNVITTEEYNAIMNETLALYNATLNVA